MPEESAPAVEAAPDVSQAPDMKDSLMAAISTSKYSEEASTAAAPQVEEQKATPTEKPVVDPAKPRKPWEAKVEEVVPDTEEEQKATDPPQIEEAPASLKPEAKVRWGELRKTEESYKALKPQFEQMKAELEQLKKAPPLPTEVEAELNELRTHRAAHDVESTPEWRTSVVAPHDAAVGRMIEVTESAKLPADKVDDLYHLVDEPNGRTRNKKVREILGNSEDDITEQDISQVSEAITAIAAAKNKANELRSKAREIRQGLTAREQQAQQAQQQAIDQKLSTASGEIFRTLNSHFQAVKMFDDPKFAQEVQSARPANISEDPMMAAYEAQAGKVLPVFMDKFNELQAELNQARKTLAARNKANPTLGDGPAAPVAPRESDDGMDELKSLVSRY